MSTIVTRSGKGSPLTNTEVDANFSNLNSGKLEASDNLSDVNNAANAATNLGLGTTDSPTFAGLSVDGNATFGDNDKAIFGAGSDLEVFHSGSDSWVKDNGTGNLYIDTDGAGVNISYNNSNENMAAFTANGAASLYYDNAKKFETAVTGVAIAGQVLATGGAVSAPTYAFDTDTDTGISRPTTNSVNIVTGGAERVRVDASGNVIVGATSAQASDAATLMSDGEVTAAGFYFSNNIGSAMNDTGIRRATTNTMVFDTDSTERMRIKPDGHLQLNGQLHFTDTGSLIARPTTNALSFNTNGSERLRIDSSGRIGIGTSSPSAVLHLGGSSNQTIQIDGSSNTAYYGTNGDRGDLFVNYDPTSGTILNSARSTVGIQMDGADGGSNIGFRTTNANNVPSSERMRIDSDGKIGIGTSSVDGSNKLQIEETTANTGTGIKIESASWDSTLTLANGSHSWEILNDYSDNSSLAFYSSQGAAVRMLLDENGNVGIGCSSPASYNSKADDLVVLTSGDTGISIISGTSNEGAIAFGDGTSGGSPIMGRVRYDHSANSMDFRVNNDEAMRIDSSGNVGIGCSPKRQLHIHNPSAASSKLQITNSTTGSSSDGKGFQIGIGSDGTANIEQRENVDLVFHTNNTERMRLDASANLLVGKTATNSNAAGIELHANDVIKVTRSSGATGYFNRLTDDGSILEFAKDGSLVGSIGSNAAGGDPVLDLTATKIMRMVVDGSTEAMRISSNGNTGIGVVPEAWHSAFNGVLQVGTYGVMAGTAGSAQFGSNFYYDGAYRRINTNYASRTYQQDGAHVFETAASGSAGSTITWSEAMRLDASGNVGIGTSSVSAKLHLGGTAPLDSIIRQDATVSGTNWEIGEREAGKWQIFEDDTDSVVATFMSSGNVGIGTNSPTQKLQVSGGSFLQQQSGATNNTAPTAVTVSNLTTGAHAAGLGASLLFTHVNSGGGYNGPKISSVSNADPFTANLVFYSHNYSHSEAMRIDSSGRIGIGTNSPSAKLDVNGEVFVSPNTAGKNTFQLTTNASNDARLKMLSDTTIKVEIQANGSSYFNGGNVGIGTQVPHRPLHINGTEGVARFTSTASGNSGLEVGVGTASQAFVWHTENAHMEFATNNIERMRIDSSGNVGIGTSSPASDYGSDTALEISGTASPGLVINDTGQASKYGIHADSNDLKITYGSGVLAAFQNDGNVGFGTSSPNSYAGQTALTINSTGVARLDLDIDNAYQGYLLAETGYIGLYAKANNYISMGVDGVGEAMRLDASGNVGIGTSSPFSTSQILNTSWSSGAPYGTVLTVTGNNTNDANWGHLLISDSTTTTGSGGSLRFAVGSTSSDLSPHAGIDGYTEGANYGGLKFLTRSNGGTATERMRLDASGNLLVGTTTDFASGTVDGIIAQGTNKPAAAFSNTASGQIVKFYEGGSLVGSIGTEGGRLQIGTGASGLYFYDSGPNVLPWNIGSNATADDSISLGSSGTRFKDAYLSGGLYLGGASSSNKLDDYEEGTWTPTTNSDATGAITSSARYRKVGAIVTVNAQIRIDTTFSGVNIGGLPFAPKNQSGVYSGVHGLHVVRADQNPRYLEVSDNSTIMFYRSDTSGTAVTPTTSDNVIRFSITYITDA